jgi:hypothetical protein
VTFYVAFGFFVVAILVIGFLAVRWAVGRDRVARAARQGEPGPTPTDIADTPGT